jgi:hypothetical protein
MRDGDVPSDSAASAKAHPIKRYIIICRLSCEILCPTTTTSIVELSTRREDASLSRGRVSLYYSILWFYGHPRPHDYSFSD